MKLGIKSRLEGKAYDPPTHGQGESVDGHNISRRFRWTGEDTVIFHRTTYTHIRFIQPKSTLGQLDQLDRFYIGSVRLLIRKRRMDRGKKTAPPSCQQRYSSLQESLFSLSHTSKNNKDAPDLTFFFFLLFVLSIACASPMFFDSCWVISSAMTSKTVHGSSKSVGRAKRIDDTTGRKKKQGHACFFAATAYVG